MFTAEPPHGVVSFDVLLGPFGYAMLFYVVQVVLQQFLVAALCYSEQLHLHLERCLSVCQSLCDVLLDGTCRLYHLVDGAVAILWQEAVAERFCQLHQHVALSVEVQLGVDSRLSHHAGCAVLEAS